MKLLLSLLGLIVILHCAYAPPVSPDKSKEEDSGVGDDLAEYTEYHRYLKEVVQALESDQEFRDRLEKANEDDIRSGKIAEQLDFVNHNVRTKLDEIKRRELERLRHLATKKFELTNNLDVDAKVSNEHLDHANPHTFEIEDLKKLIQKTSADLEAADKKRREQFKEYEMQKEFEEHQKLEELDEAKKKEYMEKVKQEKEAKKHHQPLHHPVTRTQLLEIWKSADRMDTKDFNPKVFFMMHDVDGNGVWDADEVKALFIKELDKIYSPNGPNKDLHERAEEMERMREHVFKENDRNRDGLIDFNEFMMETQRADFNQDEGWKSIDENQIYTQSEYEAFERRRLEEIRYLQQRGLVDGHGRPIPGAEHQIHQALQQKHAYEQQAYQQQYQGYPQGQHHQGQQQFQQAQYQGQQYQQGQPQYQQGQPQYQQGQPQYQPGQPQYQQGQGQYQQGQGQYQQGQGQYQQGQPQFQQIPQGGYSNQGQPQQFQQQAQQQAQYQVQQPPQPQAPVVQSQNVNPGQTIPAQPVQGSLIQTGQVPAQAGQVPAQAGQVPAQAGQVPAQAGQVQAPVSQAIQGQVQNNSNQGQVPPGQAAQGQNVQGQPPQPNPSQGQVPIQNQSPPNVVGIH